jgi:hypothetical protein
MVMRAAFVGLALALCLGVPGVASFAHGGEGPAWNMNATVIEACSCPMFCQCYFATEPAEHRSADGKATHFCQFNNAYKVNKGSYGNVKLDGAKFWMSGDLGDDFADGEMDWAVITYDKSVTKEQREAIGAITGHVFPVKWKSVSESEGEISWVASKDEATALLDGGKTAEVRLKRFQGMTNDPIVISNLKYWGAPKNDGFVLMPATAHGYNVGSKPYKFTNSNGFMITFDIDSKSVASAEQKTGGSY